MLEGDLEAEGLVIVGVERVLLDGGLLLLQSLAVLHQVDLHVRICGATDTPLKKTSRSPDLELVSSPLCTRAFFADIFRTGGEARDYWGRRLRR